MLDAHLERIDRWNPVVNAIVTRTTEQAIARAIVLDETLARGDEPGPLHGLPIAHKDLIDTAGVRTTYGSPIFAEHVPDADESFVARLRDAGSVLVGKTNTPEFGAGSHTFNPIFGPTRNPYDPSRSAGGSSGGAAAALATGMVPIADGSDLGGSLRNPASFCNVVGFRPTIPREQDPTDLSVEGPMARTVADVALLLSAMTGGPPIDVTTPAPVRRVAFAPSCAGALPVESAVVTAIEGARPALEALGCELVENYLDLEGVRDAFFTLRAYRFALDYGELLEHHRDRIKATVVWNIEQGLALSDDDVARALDETRRVRERAGSFFGSIDVLVQPVSQVPPFPVEMEYPIEVRGEAMTTYLDWMASCWSVTVLGGPAISVPCAFTEEGSPVGLQIVGRPGDDVTVLRFAHAFGSMVDAGRTRPV